MTTFLVTFDLENASASDYDRAATKLWQLGLRRQTPNGALNLPANTFAGVNSLSAAAMREAIRAAFAAGQLHTEALFVAEITDWAAWGQRARAA